LARLIATKQPDAAATAALITDIARELQPFVTPDGLHVPTSVHVVTATAP
jgi:hypothetical protein